jgi:hypothetical protein
MKLDDTLIAKHKKVDVIVKCLWMILRRLRKTKEWQKPRKSRSRYRDGPRDI